MISMTGTSTIVGSEFFYKQKFKEHTDIDLNYSFDITCKTDTIFGGGPGGGDISAMCVFTMNKEDVVEIENTLINDTLSFITTNLSQSVFSECNFEGELIIDKTYQNIIGDSMESTISFSKDRNYIVFELYYW